MTTLLGTGIWGTRDREGGERKREERTKTRTESEYGNVDDTGDPSLHWRGEGGEVDCK